jgi:hypothetical protein
MAYFEAISVFDVMRFIIMFGRAACTRKKSGVIVIPEAFGVHVIVPVVVNLLLHLFGLFELFLGDIFLL